MLLRLPPEILDIVLYHTEPSTFALLLATCKTIRLRILAYPNLIHKQLRDVPHLHSCHALQCRISGSEKLLQLFHQEAARECLNGISLTCDTVCYVPVFNARFKLAQLQGFIGIDGPSELIAAAQADSNVVHVFAIHEGYPVPRYTIQPDSDLSLNAHNVVLLKLHSINQQKCLTVLYQYMPSRDVAAQDDLHNSFTYDARKHREKTLSLVTYTLSSSDGALVISSRDITFWSQSAPVAMHCAHRGIVIIAFKFNVGYQIKVYRNSDKHHEPEPYKHTIRPGTAIASTKDPKLKPIMSLDHPFVDLNVQGSDLYVFASGCQIPSYCVADYLSPGCIMEPSTQTPSAQSGSFFGSYRWLILGTNHKHQCLIDDAGVRCCVSSILQLARLERLVTDTNRAKRPVYAIVKGSLSSEACLELDRERPLPSMEHEVVGVLDGISQHNTVSHGHIIAISKKKNRIAIAIWDRVYLFVVNTDAFLDSSIGSLMSRPGSRAERITHRTSQFMQNVREYGLDIEGDPTYSVNTGLGYYRDTVRVDKQPRRRVARLRPIELPSMGVVHKLHFVAKNTLWAWTDRGLAKWNWSKKRRGQCGRASGPDDGMKRQFHPIGKGQSRVRPLHPLNQRTQTPNAKGKDYDYERHTTEVTFDDMEWEFKEPQSGDGSRDQTSESSTPFPDLADDTHET